MAAVWKVELEARPLCEVPSTVQEYVYGRCRSRWR